MLKKGDDLVVASTGLKRKRASTKEKVKNEYTSGGSFFVALSTSDAKSVARRVLIASLSRDAENACERERIAYPG